MMRSKFSTVLTAGAIALVALSACAPAARDTSPSAPVPPTHFENPDIEELARVYNETVDSFPLELPEGYEFPAEIPPITWFDSGAIGSPIEAEATVNQWWGCAKYEAAWDAYEAGDEATASQHVEDIFAEAKNDRIGLGLWHSENPGWGSGVLRARGMGDSGYCMQWWSRLEKFEVS